jgi:hypothetical protein
MIATTMMHMKHCGRDRNAKWTSITTTVVIVILSMLLCMCCGDALIQRPRLLTRTTKTQRVTTTPASTARMNHPVTRLFSSTDSNTNTNRKSNNNFLGNFFSSLTSAVATKEILPPPPKPKYENVIIEPDLRIAALFLGLGVLLDTIPYVQLTMGPFVTLLGILFVVQTFRIRFVFTEDNQFELKTVSLSSSSSSSTQTNDEVAALNDSGENVIVGGANRWDCDTIVNYDFFPRSMMDLPFFGQPVLIYFKETQTPASTWNEGPGKIANDPDKIANGSAIPGQVHFFPAICNAKQIEQEFQKRNVQKL